MIRATCVNCHVELRCAKNSVPVIHFNNNDINQGVDALRYGDVWQCPKCETRIIIGLGDQILGIDLPDEYIKKLLKDEFVEVKRD